MRRKDREITDFNKKMDIINKCKVCRVGLSDNDIPYIIPLNFGYVVENNTLVLFFHSAMEGKKLDIIKKNNNACFEIDCDNKLIEGESACNYSYSYKSLIGFGKIIILENIEDKIFGLSSIMKHQTEKDIIHEFTQEQVNTVCVYKMIVDEFTGKHKELPQH